MGREMQKQRSNVVRQAILDAALEIGIEEGFEELSVRKLTNRINYTTSAVYHHFGNKQEIVEAVVQSQTQWLGKQIAELLDESKGIEYNFRTVFKMITDLAVNQPEKYSLIVLQKYSRKSKRPQWINVMSEHLKQGVANGEIRQLNPDHAAFCIWSSFLGFHLMISRMDNPDSREIDALFENQMQLIMKGILHDYNNI